MDLVRGDLISEAISATGVWEPQITEQLLELGRKGGMLVEVGANLGYFCLLWAAAHPSNRVHAFEPAVRNVVLLRRNVMQNGLQSRVHVFPVAAGKETGIAYFDEGPPEQTGWGGLAKDSSYAAAPVLVVRLDELFKGERVDVLKVDVEGADTWVLYGCENLLRSGRIGTIFYEQNKPRMRALGIQEGEAERFLRSVGYEPVETSEYSSADVSEWRATPEGMTVQPAAPSRP